jgi:hypothetical protein
MRFSVCACLRLLLLVHTVSLKRKHPGGTPAGRQRLLRRTPARHQTVLRRQRALRRLLLTRRRPPQHRSWVTAGELKEVHTAPRKCSATHTVRKCCTRLPGSLTLLQRFAVQTVHSLQPDGPTGVRHTQVRQGGEKPRAGEEAGTERQRCQRAQPRHAPVPVCPSAEPGAYNLMTGASLPHFQVRLCSCGPLASLSTAPHQWAAVHCLARGAGKAPEANHAPQRGAAAQTTGSTPQQQRTPTTAACEARKRATPASAPAGGAGGAPCGSAARDEAAATPLPQAAQLECCSTDATPAGGPPCQAAAGTAPSGARAAAAQAAGGPGLAGLRTPPEVATAEERSAEEGTPADEADSPAHAADVRHPGFPRLPR